MLNRIVNKVKAKYFYSENRLERLSKDELIAIVRHDCHRIEKSYYNGIFKTKQKYFKDKRDKVLLIFSILKEKNWYSFNDPVIEWAEKIIGNFYDLKDGFIDKYKTSAAPTDLKKIDPLIDSFKLRRSCRVWKENRQPSSEVLYEVAMKMIDAARWTPNSGNRQAWRFAVVTDKQKRFLLKGLKEYHCYSAPLVIFIGMDSRLYSPAYHLKDCMYIDAGAAIMQMVNVASIAGYGVCWNHLSNDLINSRKKNVYAYKNFCKELCIPKYIKPVAILSVGIPEFIPPVPQRLNVDDLII